MKTIQVNKKHQVCCLFTLDDGREYHAVKSHFKIIEEGEDSAFFFPEEAAKARKEDAEASKEFKEPILTPVDGRWSEDHPKTEFYIARVVADDTVCLCYRAYNYEAFHSPSSFDTLGEETVNSMDEARNSFTDDDSRSLTKVYLKFPTPRDSEERHMILSTKPICQEDDEVALPYDYFDITITMPPMEISHSITWHGKFVVSTFVRRRGEKNRLIKMLGLVGLSER